MRRKPLWLNDARKSGEARDARGEVEEASNDTSRTREKLF
jgi:hypothetical protein